MDTRDRPLILLFENTAEGSAADLFAADFLVAHSTKDSDAVAKVRSQRPDIIILNTDEAKARELSLCQALRKQNRGIPIFVLSGRTDLKNKVGAFENGADDFLERPYSKEELRARINARLRGWQREQKIRRGRLEIDLYSMRAKVKERTISLSVLEFHLLNYFIANEERMISREEILTAVWPSANVKSRTIDTHLVSIRKKLRGSGVEIVSLYGAGYIFRQKI